MGDWCSPWCRIAFWQIAAVVELLGSGLREFSFEPMLGFRCCHSARCLLLPLSSTIMSRSGCYDKQALDCYHALLERLGAAGRLPYRLAVPAPRQTRLIAHDDSAIALARIKAAFDPADILAPGRYDWRGVQ